MRKIDDGAFLDDAGQLWIEEEGQVDLFAPPGSPAPVTKRATGFTYLDVPTYGLFGMFWRNNPLQFASEATAKKMAEIVQTIMPGLIASPLKEEVRVGPFSWRDKWLLLVEKPGKSAVHNAGEMAATMSRHPQTFADAISKQILIEFAKIPEAWG